MGKTLLRELYTGLIAAAISGAVTCVTLDGLANRDNKRDDYGQIHEHRVKLTLHRLNASFRLVSSRSVY